MTRAWVRDATPEEAAAWHVAHPELYDDDGNPCAPTGCADGLAEELAGPEHGDTPEARLLELQRAAQAALEWGETAMTTTERVTSWVERVRPRLESALVTSLLPPR